MSKYTFKYGVMTGDDFELVENYQSRLLSYINDSDIVRLFTQTSVTTTNWGYVNWIDGAFCAPYSFFKRINFELFPIIKRRNQMSSGVGQQMSQRLNSLKFSVKNYGSLIIHNGNDDSKMHPTLRKRQPLETDLTNIEFEIQKLMISTSVTSENVEIPVTNVNVKTLSSENVLDILKLKNHIPDSILLQLPIIINRFNCNTIIRLSHLLSQCHYNTNGFNKEVVREKPNTKIINRKTFNQKVFNHLQILTEKDYIIFGKKIGKNLVDNPSLVELKYSLVASAYIFDVKNLWSICDFGINELVVGKLTKRIYEDSKSVSDRYMLFKKYYNILK
jgi:predicted chitinase